MVQNRLAIVGAGEMAQQIKHYADVDGRYRTVGFFVDYYEGLGEEIRNLNILGKVADIEEAYRKNEFDWLFIGIGYKHLKFKSSIYDQYKGKIPFATIIASPAYIDSSASVGEGSALYPGVILDKNVKIENNVILNLGATISHDSVIGQSSFIGVRTAISGFCKVGSCCFLGTNSTLVDNIEICNDVQTGAMTVVTKSINEEGVYVGSPARKIR